MNNYKSRNVDKFIKFFVDKNTPSFNETEGENPNHLNSSILQSFVNELPNFLEILNNYMNLDDDNLSMCINCINNFAQFTPKEKVAQVLLDSGAVSCLVKYGLNDIPSNITNEIFYQNILRVFNIFGEISKSKDHTIILMIIQKEVLYLCIKNYRSLDDTLNKSINFILYNLISSSFYSRGLVYSTGILQNYVSIASESKWDIPLLMSQYISALIEKFVKSGPTIGSPIPEELENRAEPLNACLSFWDNFMENYFGEIIFNKNLFEEFSQNGIIFSIGTPIYTICNYLLTLDDYLCLSNVLKTLYILVSRDCHVFPFKSCNEICSCRIPFLVNFYKFIETKNEEIIEFAMKILYHAFSPKRIDTNRGTANDVVETIVNFLISSDFNFGEKFILYAANSLTNILTTIDSFDFISDKLKCAKFLTFIYQTLRTASFEIRKAILFFYITLASDHFDNKIIYSSLKENMYEIISILESVKSYKLKIKVIKCLDYIFDQEYNNGEDELLNSFQSSDGFILLSNFIAESKNPGLEGTSDLKYALKLADKSEAFYERFYPIVVV